MDIARARHIISISGANAVPEGGLLRGLGITGLVAHLPTRQRVQDADAPNLTNRGRIDAGTRSGQPQLTSCSLTPLVTTIPARAVGHYEPKSCFFRGVSPTVARIEVSACISTGFAR